jgi:benzaldehyde dehydrogenase (NAD)
MALLDPNTWQSRPLSGGEYAVTEPATGDTLASVTLASAEDVTAAAVSARAAQTVWASTPHFQRAAVLRRAGDLFAAHADELREWIVRESGSIPGKAEFELHVAAQECYEAAALASRPTGQVLPTEAPRLSYTRRVPVGVVGVISPFNAPLILSIRSVAPALALGNAVVLKPDPRTAVCGGLALAAVFAEAGLPEDLLHVLPGGPEAGQALVADPNVPVISFTGSTAAGRAVGEAAGRHLKRVHLELGGNSALVVLEDADIDAVISTAAWGSFFHQGQICMTTGRHLVHASLYEEYVERLAAKADSLAVGDPHREQVHLGPIIDQGQLAKIHGLVEASTARGAKLAAGGTHQELRRGPDARIRGGGLRPGRAGAVLHDGRRGGGARLRDPVRPVAGHRHPRHRARSRPRRAHPDRYRPHQRPDRQRRGGGALRRHSGLRHRRPLRRRGQPGGLHRRALDDGARGCRGLSVLTARPVPA